MRDTSGLFIAVFFMLTVCIAIGGSRDGHRKREDKKIVNSKIKIYKGIDRLFMHQVGEYSYLKGGKIRRIHSLIEANKYAAKYLFIKDVDRNDKCWVGISYKWNGEMAVPYIVFHIRSEKDINGGGWRRRVGKMTKSGMTVVID